jgi:hypothetical protein
MTEGVPRHLTTAAKITAAVGVVGLGAGIAFGLSTRSKYQRCEDHVVACTKSDRDSIRAFGLAPAEDRRPPATTDPSPRDRTR